MMVLKELLVVGRINEHNVLREEKVRKDNLCKGVVLYLHLRILFTKLHVVF